MKTAAGQLILALDLDDTPGAARALRLYPLLLEAIADGRLPPGTRLPSSRQMARELRLSRGAVDEALARLQDDGLLLRRVGDGSYVASPLPPRALAPTPPPAREPNRAAQQALQHMAPLMQQSRRFEFARTFFSPPVLHPRAWPADEFPLAAWRRAVNRALGDELRDHLGYGPSTGLPALRQAIARHLGLTRAVRCRPEQVVVISGPLQGVETVVRVLLSPGDRVWVQDPGHPSLPLLLQLMQLDPVGVPFDAQGLDVARGRALAPRASLVYLHPLAQYPTGIRTTATRGAELLQWAEETGAWILEGCYNDEVVHIHPVPPALQGRDRHGRVILMGTLEGVMFPSLRIAYLVVPERLVDVFEAARGLLGDHSPMATQLALASFIDEGHFARHLRRLRRVCSERRQALIDAVRQHLPSELRLGPTDAGLHALLHLPPPHVDRELVGRLHRRGVGAEDLSSRCWQVQGWNGLILCYGASPPDAIVSAVRTLGQVLREPARTRG